jgi:hypothetical protein
VPLTDDVVQKEWQAKWLGNALFDCVRASGIIREDIGSLSVGELLFFAKDLKKMLEKMLERQAATPPAAPVPLTDDELDVCRQWFNSVKDTNKNYLTGHDYALAEKLHMHLGLRVPYSVKHAIPPAPAPVPLTDDVVQKIISKLEPLLDAKNQSWAEAERMLHGITKGQP